MAALKGIVVVERAGRLAAAIGASLLAELGATVLRVEHPGVRAPREPESWRRHPLALAGKIRLRLSQDEAAAAAQWQEILARADVLIQSPPLSDADDTPAHLIRCDVSAFGTSGTDGLPDDAGEAILQAIGGMMSTTGAENGPPEFIGAPLVEFFTGVNCAAAVAAALRVREQGGPAQRIDLSALDSSVALTGAFIGHMQLGKAHGVRAGSRHPLCCPWNAYRTQDGWVLMCSSTEPHWRRIAELIGRPELTQHPDFIDTNARQANHVAVDAAIEAWTRGRTTDQAVAAFDAVDIPVGPILTIPELLAAPDAPPVRQIALPNGRTQICPGPLLDMSRTPSRAADRVTPSKTDIAPILAPLPRKKPAPQGARVAARPGSEDGGRTEPAASATAALPLAGIRVIEVGVFTAGPLGTRYLADLGAEVIKVEQAGGETGRKWAPNFGGVSGYFATYNAGKRSIILDLAKKDDQAALERLVASADVLLQNLKAGALDRMGFGPEDTLKRHPRLIYVSVSGYGSKGAKSPALDTVVQARSGLMSLIHAPETPIKAGASVADLLASHISPLGVLVALRHRDATGEGQHIDISMRDALAWTTQLSWPDGAPALPESCRIGCADGWVVAEGAEAAALAALDGAAGSLSCETAVARLRQAGLTATRVLELDELFHLPLCRARNLFLEAVSPGGVPAPVLATPYRLSLTPLRPGRKIPGPGADNALLTLAP